MLATLRVKGPTSMELGSRHSCGCSPCHTGVWPATRKTAGRPAPGAPLSRTLTVWCRARVNSAESSAAVLAAPRTAADNKQDPRKGIQRDATQLVGATPMVCLVEY